MVLDFNKLIYYKNRDVAIVGRKYYMFDVILPKTITNISEWCKPKILRDVSMMKTDCFYDEESRTYNFLYPAE